MKKAQGLPIKVLIVAALALGFLIIMSFMFLNKGETFSKATSGCETNSGTCLNSRAACIEKGGQPMDFDCPTLKPACCML